MRFLPTAVHALLDYLWGAALIASPWLFGFADGGMAQWVAVVFGAVGIAYSLATRYELGVFDVLSMRAHLILDGVAGFALAVSPWVLGFENRVWVPFVAFGLFAVVASLVTSKRPGRVAGAPVVGEAAAGETIRP